jgi:hypothetical protein
MPKAYDTWKVLSHGPIEKLASRLWRIEGSLPDMPLKRVMTVAKRADDTLVVHNAMALDDASMKQIDDWGKVAFLLVPNGWHRLDAVVFKKRYPDAKVLCPGGSRKKVEEVMPVDGTYDDFPADDHVSLETLDGTKRFEGAMIVRAEDTSLVVTDAVFNMPHLPGVQGFVLKHLTQSSGGPRISRIAKLMLLDDKRAFAAHLDRLAETPALKRVVVAHHETIEDDPRGALRSVAASLR